jgi:ATP-binding cassette subfamily C protein
MVIAFLLTRILGLLNKTQRKYQNLAAQESAYWALRSAIEGRAAAERTTGSRQPAFSREFACTTSTSHDVKPIFRT